MKHTTSVRNWVRAACLMLPISLCAPAFAQSDAAEDAYWAHERSDLRADENVRFGRLENGMGFAILRNETPPGTASVRMAINVGALSETDPQQGLAHFIEHMAFNGTTNVPEGEMVHLLERYGLAFGADTNASTSETFVNYRLDMPNVDAETLDAVMFLMRETASEILMQTGAIDRERGVIMGEMRSRDTPLMQFWTEQAHFHYPGSVMAERNVIGTPETIQNVPRSEFVDYYTRYYTPERAILVVVGDVDPEDIENRIRNGFPLDIDGIDVDQVEGFSTWERTDIPTPLPSYDSDRDYSQPDFEYFHHPEALTLITVDAISEQEAAPDSRNARIQSMLRNLGSSILSRRFQVLVNSGNAPISQASVFSSEPYDAYRRGTVFAVGTPAGWRDAVGLLENEIRRAVEHGFTQAELDEQLANMRTNMREAAEEAGTRESANLSDGIWFSWLADNVFTHPSDSYALFQMLESAITVEAVEAAFREYWTSGAPLVMVGSREEIADGEDEVRRVWDAASQIAVEAPEEVETAEWAYTDFGTPGRIVAQSHDAELDVHQYTFDNGVRLNVKQTEFADNEVRVRIDFGAGNLGEQPAPASGAMAFSALSGGGLEAHTPDEITRIFAGRSVSQGGFTSNSAFAFNGATTPTDFEAQMELYAAYFTAPGWRSQGLDQFKAISGEIRRLQMAQTFGAFNTVISRMLRDGDQRFGFPTEEEVENFTVDHARAFLEPALQDGPMEITIIGDIDPAEAVRVAARTLGALPPRRQNARIVEGADQLTFPAPTPEAEIIRFAGQEYQGMANVFWPTDDGRDTHYLRTLHLLRSILRLRATDLFREQEAATYSAAVNHTAGTTYEDYGYLWLGLDVTADQVTRMFAIADQLAADMASGNITEDELLRARTPIIEGLDEQRRDNQYWLGGLARSQRDPERMDRLRDVAGQFEAVTLDEIRALATEVFDPDAAVRYALYSQDADLDNLRSGPEDE
ncbi:pitrilysin family protein [Maricaulis sp.]|uniref:M16 family metallopeptidase n=1 Tax=Maricaulis sp. TaxID=1486257 RepID=UPI001B06785F|nr:M16 family metallopeptidase [Maricaulis sp.]MBO6798085.1 insulinase family protein [Maricaulis sp.]